MEFPLIAAYCLFFLFLIGRLSFFKLPGLPVRSLQLVFLLKLGAGFMLWAIYTFYYTNRATADIYKYFDDSKVMFEALQHHPRHFFQMLTGIGNDGPEFAQYYNSMHYWARAHDTGIYNDSHTIIRLNAFLRLFSFGYFHVHTVFFCFLSLSGLCAIYRCFETSLHDKRPELFFLVFFLPSTLFWTSGVLKEAIIICTLGFLCYFCSRLFSVKALLICIVCAAVLALSKFYVWICILPSLVYLLVMNKSGERAPFIKLVIILAFFMVAGLSIHKVSSIQDPLITLSQKQQEFRMLAEGRMLDSNMQPISTPQSAIVIPDLEPTLSSVIINAPVAIANVLFRPLPWEIRSILMIPAGAENIIVLALICISLLFSISPRAWPWKWILFCLTFVILQFIIIGETTPILGAVARYRCIALPFLCIVFLLILDKQKLCRRWPLYARVFGKSV
jgi:hypothetical protein